MTLDYKQMLADRAAGTQGPWRPIYEPDKTDSTTWLVERAVGGLLVAAAYEYAPGKGSDEINARRIARIPDMEAEIIRLRELLHRAEQEAE